MSTRQYGRRSFEASNEDKVLFPAVDSGTAVPAVAGRDARPTRRPSIPGITKGELIDYYEAVSGAMLRHLRDRPLVMKRYPDGINAKSFFQKQVSDYFPDWIDTVTVRKAGGRQDLVVCNTQATLAYLANQACITPHSWLSRADRLDHPDRLILDLDPPEGCDDFEPVRRAALDCRELLDELGLPAYIQTTGSKGVHVVVPLDRRADFDTVRAFARDLAAVIAARHPDRLTVEHYKAKRQGRLYLDAARNAYAQSAVAPYAVRARPGAPVATPITWNELADRKLHARSFTLREVPKRLEKVGDPWADLRRRARSLTAARRALAALTEHEKA